MADDLVKFPVLGYKNSINVSVAFGIAVYEIQRQHWPPYGTSGGGCVRPAETPE